MLDVMAKTLPVVSAAASAEPEDLVREVVAIAGSAGGIDGAVLEALFRAWSRNTRRAFRSDLLAWWRWCQGQGVRPAAADGALAARWVRALAGVDPSEEPARAIATIERYLVHVGRAYRLAGLSDPTGAELVRLELKAAKVEKRVRQRQAQALRFKGDIADLDSPAAGLSLLALLKSCRRDALGYRDAALLRTAYDIGGRRSELVAIRIAEIDGPDADGAGSLLIPVSKTDRTGEGAYAYLSSATMAAIARWRTAAKIDGGPLFRRVYTHFDGSVDRIGREALHANSVTLILKRLARVAAERGYLGELSENQIERLIASISSHSIRVGVAQDNFVAGEGLPAIMQAYRWKDPRTVMRYGAKLAAKSGASARLAKRFE